MAELVEKKLTCTVVTPERALLECTADFVAIPMYDGEIGVLPNRAPLVGRLGCGELRIRANGAVKRFFVDEGFLQVRDNVVTVLTARAQESDAIDVEAARAALEKAGQQSATTPAALRQREKDQQRARAQIRTAERIKS